MTAASGLRRCGKAEDDQKDVVSYLSDPSAYARKDRPFLGDVECIRTHAALVFLAGADAYKIKRAVKYEYLDFSTLEKRRRVIWHELRVNRANAPEIYLGVVPITREHDGRLAIGGAGGAVEWALHMRRFPTKDILAIALAQSRPSSRTIRSIAERIAQYHEQATVTATPDGAKRIGSRKEDASDATSDVVGKQYAQGTGPIGWPLVEAGGTADATLMAATCALKLSAAYG